MGVDKMAYTIEVNGELKKCFEIEVIEGGMLAYTDNEIFDNYGISGINLGAGILHDTTYANGFLPWNQVVPDEYVIAHTNIVKGYNQSWELTNKNGDKYSYNIDRSVDDVSFIVRKGDSQLIASINNDYKDLEFKLYPAALKIHGVLWAVGLFFSFKSPYGIGFQPPATSNENAIGWSRGDTVTDLSSFANSVYAETSDNVTESQPNGGFGTNHTPDNIDVPALPSINLQATGLRIYEPENLSGLMSWIWSDTFFDNILKNWQSPLENIVSLYVTNVPLTEMGTTNIIIGGLDSGTSGKIFSSTFAEVDCGSVSLREKFGTYLDYSLGTQCELYLPYVGVVNVDINKLMNNTIKVVYHVELMSGDAVAYIFVTDKRDNCYYVLDSFSCNIANNIALSQTTQMNRQSAWVNGILSTTVSAASSPASALATGVNFFANAMMTSQQTIQKGNMRGFAGLMGVKNPYLIVTRNVATKPKQYEQDYGYYSMISKTLSTLKNGTFVKCSEAHIESVVIPDFFTDEIENLLNGGVFI